MTDSDSNPYSSPSTDGPSESALRQKPTYRPIVRWFVLPFCLAHLVFWPTLVVTLQFTNGRDYGLTGVFNATIAVAIAGAVYGTLTGRWVAKHFAFGIHPVFYAVGQAIWFVTSVFTPCAVFVVVA